MKAVAKEPKDRYDTAADLAGDLRRFLQHEPIHARRPSLLERAAKGLHRHRPGRWCSSRRPADGRSSPCPSAQH